MENTMRTLNNVEKYSKTYDEVMNAELEVVHNAYDGRYGKYSIKLPNSMTGMEYYEFSSGYKHPDYTKWKSLPEYLKSDESLADNPRHNCTKRIFYKSLEKARAALFYIKSLEE